MNRWLRGLRARTFCLVVARYDGIQEPTLRTPIKTSEIYALAASNSSLHRNSDSHSGAHWCHHTAKDDFHRGRSTVPRAIRWPTPIMFRGVSAVDFTRPVSLTCKTGRPKMSQILMVIRVRSSLSHGSRREPFCFTSTPHNFVPRNRNIEQYFHLYIPALSGARSTVVLRVHFCSKRAKILSGVHFGLLPVRRNSARRPPTKHQLECGWLRDQIHGIQRQVRSTHKTTRV